MGNREDIHIVTDWDAANGAADQPDRHRRYRYYDLVMVGFVTVLLCSNLIGPAKLSEIHLPVRIPGMEGNSLTFGAGNIFFPIGYIFGDVLTEVYGYARARKVIWAGFGALLFATIMANIIIWLPNKATNDYGRQLQPALELVFGNTFRISAASLIAFWCGDFANSFVMARMKLWTGGRWLWTRTIGSTLVGQGVDSLLFYPIAFAGIWASSDLIQTCAFNWGFKVSIEVLFTPLTYLVVNFLKRAENEDFYDVDTNFTPFSLQD
jgi:uncharacterized integral membrane protein (TIGR00697 family)